eukprot:scaffold77_cov163-Alexandrium_tamarense.AAC.4
MCCNKPEIIRESLRGQTLTLTMPRWLRCEEELPHGMQFRLEQQKLVLEAPRRIFRRRFIRFGYCNLCNLTFT